MRNDKNTIILAINHSVSGGATQYYRVSKAPFHVGRAFSNDIIVDDPFICGKHIKILFSKDSNSWIIDGFETVNGFHVNDIHYADDIVEISSGDIIRLGKTRIMVYSVDHPIDATEALADNSSIFSIFERSFNSWLLFFVALITGGYLSYISSWTADSFYDDAVMVGMIVGLVITIWASIWGIISRINRHKFYFSSHIGIFSAFFIISAVIFNVAEYIAFWLHENTISQAISDVTFMSLVCLLIYYSLIFATNMRRKKAFMGASIFTIGLFASLILTGIVSNMEFKIFPNYPSIIKPHFYNFGISTDTTGFIKESEELFNNKKLLDTKE